MAYSIPEDIPPHLTSRMKLLVRFCETDLMGIVKSVAIPRDGPEVRPQIRLLSFTHAAAHPVLIAPL